MSRLAIGVYARVPIFGRLRGAVGVIRQGDRFLVIDRSDGLGLSFPGGLAHAWETEEAAVAREVREETGLTVTSKSLVMQYDHDWPYPHSTSVYDVEAAGEVRGSWEGQPVWVDLRELRQGVVRNQREIVAKLAG